MDENERIEAIDELAGRMLNHPSSDGKPATEVWDHAAAIIDRREAKARAWAIYPDGVAVHPDA